MKIFLSIYLPIFILGVPMTNVVNALNKERKLPNTKENKDESKVDKNFPKENYNTVKSLVLESIVE